MITWLRKHWKYLLLLFFALLIPFILQLVMTHVVRHSTLDGWLGFWGGYLGAIISVHGIYYEVSKELKVSKEQYQASKYPKIRIVIGPITLKGISPKIIQQYPGETLARKLTRYRAFTGIWRMNDQRIAGISFANISQNKFYDAIVIVEYSPYKVLESDSQFHGRMKDRTPDRFAIPEMGDSPDTVTILFVSYLLKSYFDNSAKKSDTVKEIHKITIYGQTETSQIIKMQFDKIRSYNYIPRKIIVGEDVKKEYDNLMSEDIFPLIRLTRDFGEKREVIIRVRNALNFWIEIRKRHESSQK